MSETSAINEFIGSEVKSQDVVLFMKGTPGFPQCGFSGQVVQILDYLDIDYKGVNVLTSDELREGIKGYSQWPTIISSVKCSKPVSFKPILKKKACHKKAKRQHNEPV